MSYAVGLALRCRVQLAGLPPGYSLCHLLRSVLGSCQPKTRPSHACCLLALQAGRFAASAAGLQSPGGFRCDRRSAARQAGCAGLAQAAFRQPELAVRAAQLPCCFRSCRCRRRCQAAAARLPPAAAAAVCAVWPSSWGSMRAIAGDTLCNATACTCLQCRLCKRACPTLTSVPGSCRQLSIGSASGLGANQLAKLRSAFPGVRFLRCWMSWIVHAWLVGACRSPANQRNQAPVCKPRTAACGGRFG